MVDGPTIVQGDGPVEVSKKDDFGVNFQCLWVRHIGLMRPLCIYSGSNIGGKICAEDKERNVESCEVAVRFLKKMDIGQCRVQIFGGTRWRGRC